LRFLKNTDEPFEEKVLGLLYEALDAALADRKTQGDLETLARSGLRIDAEVVHHDVVDDFASVLEACRTMLGGWIGAEERSQETKKKLAKLIRPISGFVRIGAVLVLGSIVVLLSAPLLVAFVPLAFLVVPAYLRLFGELVELRTLELSRNESRDRFVHALRVQTVVAVREAINRRLTSFSTDFRIFDRRGLRQLADPDREVSTTAVTQLETLVGSLDSGSIGISGPRGCGKTTLIRRFTEGESMPFAKERIGLTVSAPVKYDAREFVLHLFASLCERVLDEGPGKHGLRSSRGRARRMRVLRWLGPAALALIVAGLVLLLEPSPPSRQTTGIVLLALGGGGALVWAVIGIELTPWWSSVDKSFRALLQVPPSDESLVDGGRAAANEYLKQIRFQQSRQAGGAAEVSLPLGLSLGGSTSTTLARTPWTLPEAVAEFRNFAGTLSDKFVVIGIDELDKMESDEAAREFLNNVKGVFGVTGCYYLVSVSEDAMSTFERRGLPLRDVFDSSFDEIMRVGYLDLPHSRRVLESRVTGLPVPFQCLCHCLAGGLPRDLIRVARELLHQYDIELIASGGRDVPMALLAWSLGETEWERKLKGTIAAGRSAKQTRPRWLSEWLHLQTVTPFASSTLRDLTTDLREMNVLKRPAKGEEALEAQRIALEMTTFNYYSATVLDLFGDGQLERFLDPHETKTMSPEGMKAMEQLAMARQQFSVDPWISWGLIHRVREQVLYLLPWDDISR
jgi:hypothetical protein